MINLSRIYFAGEDPPNDLPQDRFPAKRNSRISPKRDVADGRKGGGQDPEQTRWLSRLFTFILRQSGLDSNAYRPKALNRRLGACLRVLRATSEEAALNKLQRKPELVEASLSVVLIGVSEFFRDAGVFEHLKRGILPELLQKNGTLRVYSAGCSAGHELYSVAMILDEIGRLHSNQLLGVDCRPDAIEHARSGCFAVSDLKDMGRQRQQRYFGLEGRHATISPRLSERVTWQVADLGVFRGPKPWDLILFRNVAIYLELEYANTVWHLLDEQLKPGGIVVTGSAERPPQDLFWTRESACIYRKPPTLTS